MMTKQSGLFSLAKAMIVLVVAALSLPNLVFAQSDQAARVKINGATDVFGDVLLARDGDDIVLYGLAGAVPPLSAVAVEAGSQNFQRNASFPGKFPILSDVPIRIVGGANIETATISATTGAGTFVGTVSLNLNNPEILQNLQTYQDLIRQGRTDEADEAGVPPHSLLRVIAEDPNDQSLVGRILLTQRFIGSGPDAVILDQLEGLSGGGFAADNRYRSVPPFSVVEVYTEPVDVNNPDRTKRIETIQTEIFHNGEFVSNGSFSPFNVANGEYQSLYLRITSRMLAGASGQPPKIFLARVDMDNSAVITSANPTNNNTRGDANAPGSDGIAIIRGQIDPYGLVTAYRENSATSDVLAQAVADAAGNYSLLIPGIYGEDGLYRLQQSVFISALDVFGNTSGLQAVALDSQSMQFEVPVATQQADGTFTIAGVAEPAAIILVTGRNIDGSVSFHAGDTIAAADGSYSVNVSPAYDFIVTAIDLAGNRNDSAPVAAEQGTPDPANLVASASYPNIQLTGTVEPSADVLVFAFPLNQVPTSTAPSDTQPANSFFLTGTRAGVDGNFTVLLPSSTSRVVYVQAVDTVGNRSRFIGTELVDAQGNPLSRGLVAFDNIQVRNNPPGVPDVLTGRTVSSSDGQPVAGVFVGAYLTMVQSESPIALPFAEPLSPEVFVNNDGTFSISIPDRSPDSETFVESFYLVAMEQQPDLSYSEVGFQMMDTSAGFDRVGPEIVFSPLREDVQLLEYGCGVTDYMNIINIMPAGTGSSADLPADALPFISILADGNDDNVIDVNNPGSYVVLDRKPLDAILGFQFGMGALPFSGVTGLRLGENCWDAARGVIRGNSVVFIALTDAAGNLSPNPLPVRLDVFAADPDASLITARGTDIFGGSDSVEADSVVTVYENANRTGLIGSTRATSLGAFAISGLTLTVSNVYVGVRDNAGNESNLIKVKVSNPFPSSPLDATPFLVLDQLGLIHTANATIDTGLASPSTDARALANVKGNNSLQYVLLSNGSINKIGVGGKLPASSRQLSLSVNTARDLVVVSADPFQGYALLGNGVIIPFGGAPFFGDIAQIQSGSSGNRLPLADSSAYFDDTNGNGVYDTEDTNGNGVLDIVVGTGGVFLVNEDTNGNGELDSEPIIHPDNLVQGFEADISRELEIVQDSNGTVRGYVILDGFGVMWAFGNDINAGILNPQVTNGVSSSDVFRAFELVVDESGRISDFITLNGFGQVFGSPGGLLGAGPATTVEYAGHLSVVLGATDFGFDIARDIRANPVDANGDGSVDYRDGFYILDGFGGIHAIGGAGEIENAPFLGFDVARDLEFGASVNR